MKKRILQAVLIVFSVITISLGISSTSYAYTEEEKQQAKAWLSAHGYSPDMAGAGQAYQDYLNGKFDEELGINTTEQGALDDPVTDKNDTVTGGAGTDEKSEISDSTVTDEKDDAVKDSDNGKKSDAKNKDTSGQAQPENGYGGTEKKEEISTETIENNQTEDGKGTIAAISGIEKNKSQHAVTVYQAEKTDTYKEAGMVILFSVLFVVVVEAIIALCRK